MVNLLLFFVLTPLGIYIGKSILKGRNNPGNSQRYPVGTHVVISGGSKGIGKALALKFAELGTHVTIIARNTNDLHEARAEIERHRKNTTVQKIRTVSLDLTKLTFPDSSSSDATSQQQELLDKILGEHERCDILVNCCGSAIAARFEDTSQQQFRYMMDVNYFSAVNLTRILLPVMKARSLANQAAARSNGGRIVFVSSMCGLMSFFGYSAYSASKFAIVGLAEALNMEVQPFNISVTVSFPPDTNTPGFEEENKTKPSLTAKISETGNVYSPEEVAAVMMADIRTRKFYSTVGIENLLVLTTMNTFMPTPSYWKALVDIVLAGPLKLVGFIIVRSWYKLVEAAAPNEMIKAEVASKCTKSVK